MPSLDFRVRSALEPLATRSSGPLIAIGLLGLIAYFLLASRNVFSALILLLGAVLLFAHFLRSSQNPDWAILSTLVLIILPLPNPAMIRPLSVPIVLEIILVSHISYRFLVRKERFYFPGPESVAVGGLLLAFIVTNTLGAGRVWPNLNEPVVRGSVVNLLLFFAIVNVGDVRPFLEKMGRYMVFMLYALSGMLIYHYLLGTRVRPGSGAVANNESAALILALLPWAVERYLHEPAGRWRSLAMVAIPLALLANLFTFSRTGFVCTITVLSLIVYVYRRYSRLKWFLGVMVLATVMVAPAGYWARMQTIVTDETGGSGRTEMWARALGAFLDHPVVGVGMDRFRLHHWDYAVDTQMFQFYTAPAHNVYLEMAAGGGLVVLGFFGAVVYFCGRRMWDHVRYYRGRDPTLERIAVTIVISELTYLVGGMFHSFLLARLPFLLLALTVLLRRLREEEAQRKALSAA